MKIVFMGTPEFAVPSLQALCAAGHEVAGVFSNPDRPSGRKMELKPTPVKAAALELGLPVVQCVSLRKDPEALAKLQEFAPEAIVVAAFGQILPKEVLDLPKYGCLNVHASLLPKYRGAAPIQWAVINGEAESGVTIMQMGEGLDTGDMLSRAVVPLTPDETGGSLFDKLAEEGAKLLCRTLEKLPSGELCPEKQPQESPTPYARMITKQDGRIDWTQSASSIECRIRGLDPWPCAFTSCEGKTMKLWKAAVCPENAPDAAPGTVAAVKDGFLYVQTGDGLLEIRELQAEGRKRMKTADFLRGHSIAEGTVLG